MTRLLPRVAPVPSKRDSTRSNTAPIAKKAGDRFAVLNSVVDVSLAGLSRSEIAVWLVLYRDVRNGTVCISQCEIARRAGCTDRQVRRSIDKLIASKLLGVVFHGGINQGPSRYRVCAVT